VFKTSETNSKQNVIFQCKSSTNEIWPVNKPKTDTSKRPESLIWMEICMWMHDRVIIHVYEQ